MFFVGVLLVASRQSRVFGEGSAQSGLNQLIQEYSAAASFDRTYFVDILSVGEVINVSVCGENNTDSLTVEIFDPLGFSVFFANTN